MSSFVNVIAEVKSAAGASPNATAAAVTPAISVVGRPVLAQPKQLHSNMSTANAHSPQTHAVAGDDIVQSAPPLISVKMENGNSYSPVYVNSPPPLSTMLKSALPTRHAVDSMSNNIITTGSAIPLKPQQHHKLPKNKNSSLASRSLSNRNASSNGSVVDRSDIDDLLDGAGNFSSGHGRSAAALNMSSSAAQFEAVLLPDSPTPSPPPDGGSSQQQHQQLHQHHASSHYRPQSAASDVMSPTKRKRRTKDEGIKGLRYFALQVCEKVRTKRQTNYNSVAEELVNEHTRPPYFQPSAYTPDQIAGEQKNIRRRVYDALNVLMALNIIQKDGRDIRWNGFPRILSEAGLSAEDTRVNRRRRLIQNEQDTMELMLGIMGTMHVIDENRQRQGKVPSRVILDAMNIGVDADQLGRFIHEHCMDDKTIDSAVAAAAGLPSATNDANSQPSSNVSQSQYRHPSELLQKAEDKCIAETFGHEAMTTAAFIPHQQHHQQQLHRATQREPMTDDDFCATRPMPSTAAAELLAAYRHHHAVGDQLHANVKKALPAQFVSSSSSSSTHNNNNNNSEPISSSATESSLFASSSASMSSVITGDKSTAAVNNRISDTPTDNFGSSNNNITSTLTDNVASSDLAHAHAADFGLSTELHATSPTTFGDDDVINIGQLYAMQTDMQQPPRPPPYYAYEADHNPYGGGTNNFDYYQQRYGRYYHKQDQLAAATAAAAAARSSSQSQDFCDIATLPPSSRAATSVDDIIIGDAHSSSSHAAQKLHNSSLYYQNNNGTGTGSLQQQQQHHADNSGDSARVYKPFLFIVSPLDAALDCSIATDQTNYEIKFSTPFKVYDEMEVMRMQPFVLKFERQQMTPEEREQALEYLPDKLKKGYDYIKSQLLLRRREEEEEIHRRLRMEARRKEIEAQKAAAAAAKAQIGRASSSAPGSALLGGGSSNNSNNRPNTASLFSSTTGALPLSGNNKRLALSTLPMSSSMRASSASVSAAANRRTRPLPPAVSATATAGGGLQQLVHPKLVKGVASMRSANVPPRPLPMLPTLTGSSRNLSETAFPGAVPSNAAVLVRPPGGSAAVAGHQRSALHAQSAASASPRPPGMFVHRSTLNSAAGTPGGTFTTVATGGTAATAMLSNSSTADGSRVLAAMTNGVGRRLPLIPTKLTREQLEQLQRERKIIPIALVNTQAGGGTSTGPGSAALFHHTTSTTAAQPRTYALLTTAGAVASTVNTFTSSSSSSLSSGAGSSGSLPVGFPAVGGVFTTRKRVSQPPSKSLHADTTTSTVRAPSAAGPTSSSKTNSNLVLPGAANSSIQYAGMPRTANASLQANNRNATASPSQQQQHSALSTSAPPARLSSNVTFVKRKP